MQTGNLTPRTNCTIDAMRFSGDFGQPDGFGSVLDVQVKKSGEVCFTLTYKMQPQSAEEHMWSVTLTEEQRRALAGLLVKYHPRTYERYEPD